LVEWLDLSWVKKKGYWLVEKRVRLMVRKLVVAMVDLTVCLLDHWWAGYLVALRDKAQVDQMVATLEIWLVLN
jgi:hypothetical protein